MIQPFQFDVLNNRIFKTTLALLFFFFSCDEQTILFDPTDYNDSSYSQNSYSLSFENSEFSYSPEYENQGLSPLLSIGRINEAEDVYALIEIRTLNAPKRSVSSTSSNAFL